MSSVRIKALRKAYTTVSVLNGISLDVEDGEFLVLLGPSGCGKSTTLRSVAGLEEADDGKIIIGAATVFDRAAGIFVQPNQRDIGMVFQSYALWPHMTVAQNVAYPIKARSKRADAVTSGVRKALALVDLLDHADRYPHQLSGGQQQRVALARAVAANPALVLFDEPLSNLDAQLRHRLRDDLRAFHKSDGRTSIYVTHDQTEALALADRVVIMQAGSIEQIGTPTEVFSRPSTRFVAEFLGVDNFLSGIVERVDASVVLVRPHGWAKSLVAFSTDKRVPGQAVTLGFRSSSAEAVEDGPAGAEQNILDAQLRDLAYFGDHYRASIVIGQSHLNATVPVRVAAKAETALRVRIPSDELIILPDQKSGLLTSSHQFASVS